MLSLSIPGSHSRSLGQMGQHRRRNMGQSHSSGTQQKSGQSLCTRASHYSQWIHRWIWRISHRCGGIWQSFEGPLHILSHSSFRTRIKTQDGRCGQRSSQTHDAKRTRLCEKHHRGIRRFQRYFEIAQWYSESRSTLQSVWHEKVPTKHEQRTQKALPGQTQGMSLNRRNAF